MKVADTPIRALISLESFPTYLCCFLLSFLLPWLRAASRSARSLSAISSNGTWLFRSCCWLGFVGSFDISYPRQCAITSCAPCLSRIVGWSRRCRFGFVSALAWRVCWPCDTDYWLRGGRPSAGGPKVAVRDWNLLKTISSGVSFNLWSVYDSSIRSGSDFC